MKATQIGGTFLLRWLKHINVASVFDFQNLNYRPIISGNFNFNHHMKSIFTNKSEIPTIENLEKGLASTADLWKKLEEFTVHNDPKAKPEWKFSGEKFGWSYRINDAKRVIVYLLPRQHFFKIAFVFGNKATEKILESDVSELIKNELRQAKVHAEGRGIRIDVCDDADFDDLKKLILIKIGN